MTKDAIPTSNEEIISQATRQAKTALQSKPANVGVGYAEGVIKIGKEVFTSVWCAVITEKGDIGLGGGLNIKLTDSLEQKYVSGILTQNDLEKFIEQVQGDPYEILIRQALLYLKSN